MTKQLHIVVRHNGAERHVCSSGQKPFIGPLEQAKDLANFLKSVNKEDTYEIFAVGASKGKGAVTDRYTAPPKEEPKNAKKRPVRK